VQPSVDQLKATEGFTLIPGAAGWVKFARKLTVTCSFAKQRGKKHFYFCLLIRGQTRKEAEYKSKSYSHLLERYM
jgi:hypothetical protein